MRILLSLAVGIVFIFALAAHSTVINVPADYPTIQQGINAAVNGDTVLVADGVYTESLNYQGKAITVISLNGPLSTIITNSPSINLVVFENSENNDSILEGFTLQGGWMAIWCQDSGPTIRKNIILDQNINNWATISLGGQGMGTFGSSPITIENCTIVGGVNGAISTFSTDTVTVVNTIIAFNDYGIHVQDPSTCPIELGYNDVFGNGVNYYNVNNYGPGTIILDPLFNLDYSLQPGSPCIDAGDPNFPYDPDGTVIDIGAIYYHHIQQPGQIILVPQDYQTIQAAINASSDGDTILVADGIYAENLNFIGKAILVVSENGPEFTTIQLANSGIPVVSFISGERRNSIIEGFTIIGDLSFWGIHVVSSSPTIYKNVIKFHEAGVRVQTGGPLIRKNEISFCEHVDIDLHKGAGIYLDYSNGAIIDSNYIYNNLADVDPGLVVSYCNNISISRNLLFDNNATDYLNCVGIDNCSEISFLNNTVSDNIGPDTSLGSVVFNHCHDFSVINNIISFNSDWGLQKLGNTYNYIIDFNDVYGNNSGNYNGFSPGPNCISLDPMYVGGDPFDYHLQPGSPCIDAGDPNSPLDPDGSIADMGALFSGGVVTDYGFDIADVYGENNQPVSVPVTAFGLADQDIAGAEFHISFDDACLQYDTTVSDYFSNMLVNVVNEEIHILWEDYANPVFLPESTAAFELQFTVLGQLGDTCTLDWLSNNEIVDSTGSVISGIEFTEGEVRVIEFHSVSGRVIYYDMVTPLEDINMELSGDWTATEITDQNGFYQFENLFPGDFMICPERDVDDPGVTVSDVVKIRRHLVLLELFDSPYKYVAADVNESDYVSVADIIKIRRYLAGLEPLPSGNWSFVDSSFAITNENWMDAPDCAEFEIWGDDLTDSSFVGVRMGDVDVTLGINGGPPVVADNVLLDLIDVQGAPGDTVVMPLLVQGFVEVAGIEIHMEYPNENLEFTEISSTLISDYTINVVDGEIHLIWEDIDNSLTLPSNSELLSISFEILPGTTEDLPVNFTSAYIVNVQGTDFNVYTSDAIVHLIPVSAEENTSLPVEFGLHQNYPNPFNAKTTIKFDVPKSSQVSINIYDLLGRKIQSLIDTRVEAGYHDISWNSSDFPSGIYFYVMKAEDYICTNKMMLLK